jgi:hypothetical protein
MKTKIHSQSGALGSRVLIVLLFCVAAFFITTAIPTTSGLGFFRAKTPATDPNRTLTFGERVAYQRAIEDVYWRHRIWPEERPDPKPSLDAVMPQAQLEEKVVDYLRNSQALEDYWQRPIAAEQLQGEIPGSRKSCGNSLKRSGTIPLSSLSAWPGPCCLSAW